MAGWTVGQLPPFAGRTVVVSGANSGIGFEVTRAFANSGATVIMACRNLDRGTAARDEFRDHEPARTLDLRELDLADHASIRGFADSIDGGIDVPCNDAGVMAIPRMETTDGFEAQFGINHLGHFALTGLLPDRLGPSPTEIRFVTQSSGIHERDRIDFDDIHGVPSYDEWGADAQSKLANGLFAYELDRRLRSADIGHGTSVACHPGYAVTNLQRRGPEATGSTLRLWAMRIANAVFAQSAHDSELPMVDAATVPELDGGEYIGLSGFMTMRGPPEPQPSSGRSYEESTARRLWQLSTELTGVDYDFDSID